MGVFRGVAPGTVVLAFAGTLMAGGSGSGEDEEDAPEVISFYGLEIEGDSFNFCFAAYAW